MEILDSRFFSQKTLKVAKDLIGCYLMREIDGEVCRYKITETEAYVGPHDLASHSSKGRTARTEVMFAEPGTIYIYMIYGMYFMLNIVTEKKDYPAAVLIRGVTYVGNNSRAEGDFDKNKKLNGPGKLTKAIKIDKILNGVMATRNNGLWFEAGEHLLDGKSKNNSEKIPKRKFKIKRTKRVGVDYAGPVWAEKEYRFIMEM